MTKTFWVLVAVYLIVVVVLISFLPWNAMPGWGDKSFPIRAVLATAFGVGSGLTVEGIYRVVMKVRKTCLVRNDVASGR
jgi:hypothetical protein